MSNEHEYDFKRDGGFEILLKLRFDAISKILQRAELAHFSKMSCGYGDGVLGSSDAKKELAGYGEAIIANSFNSRAIKRLCNSCSPPQTLPI